MLEKVTKLEKNLPSSKNEATASKNDETDKAKKRKREEKADKKDKEVKQRKTVERQVRFDEGQNLVINSNERKWNDHKKQSNMLKGAFSPAEISQLSEAL